MLLRNVNGDHFEEARVFHPLPFDEELTKKESMNNSKIQQILRRARIVGGI